MSHPDETAARLGSAAAGWFAALEEHYAQAGQDNPADRDPLRTAWCRLMRLHWPISNGRPLNPADLDFLACQAMTLAMWDGRTSLDAGHGSLLAKAADALAGYVAYMHAIRAL